eukprot:1148089-Pelagomonas_calceolata.AAC.3
MQVSWGIDLATEHERFLTEELFKQPVIVYDYPKEIKAFYMKLNEDGKTVAAMDVLVPKVCARGPLTNMSRKGLLRGLKAINWPCSSYAPAAVAVTMQCRCNELALQQCSELALQQKLCICCYCVDEAHPWFVARIPRSYVMLVGELIGGSQREDRYDTLKARIEATGMDAGPYEQYLDIRKVSTVSKLKCFAWALAHA